MKIHHFKFLKAAYCDLRAFFPEEIKISLRHDPQLTLSASWSSSSFHDRQLLPLNISIWNSLLLALNPLTNKSRLLIQFPLFLLMRQWKMRVHQRRLQLNTCMNNYHTERILKVCMLSFHIPNHCYLHECISSVTSALSFKSCTLPSANMVGTAIIVTYRKNSCWHEWNKTETEYKLRSFHFLVHVYPPLLARKSFSIIPYPWGGESSAFSSSSNSNLCLNWMHTYINGTSNLPRLKDGLSLVMPARVYLE